MRLRASHASLLAVFTLSAAGIAYIHIGQSEERSNLKRGLAQDDLRYKAKLMSPAAVTAGGGGSRGAAVAGGGGGR